MKTIEEMQKRKKELGYSNRQLSKLSGIPFGTVQKILGGYTEHPRFDTKRALEKVLFPEETTYASVETYTSVERVTPESLCVREKSSGNYLYGSTADDSDRKRPGDYTVADWEHLPGDRRVELMDGILYDMANPALVHQLILSSLLFQLLDYVEKNHGDCRVIPAPIGVRLEKDDKTMLEPDLVVVCSPEKLRPKWLEGAPDLVIEILSPSTCHRDLTRKFSKYESAGVRSYWVVDPEKKRILVYNFEEDDLLQIHSFRDQIPVTIWDNQCVVDFTEIWKQISFLYDENGTLKT